MANEVRQGVFPIASPKVKIIYITSALRRADKVSAPTLPPRKATKSIEYLLLNKNKKSSFLQYAVYKAQKAERVFRACVALNR